MQEPSLPSAVLPGLCHLLQEIPICFQPHILNPFLVLCHHVSLFSVSSAITARLYLHSMCKAVVLEESRMQNWLGWSPVQHLSVYVCPLSPWCHLQALLLGLEQPECLSPLQGKRTAANGALWHRVGREPLSGRLQSRIWRVSTTAQAEMVPVRACTRGFGDTLSH